MATNGIAPTAQASATQASTAGPSNGNASNANVNISNAAKPQINLISAITQAFRNQTGEPLQNDRIASLLLQHMPQLGELAKQGKLNYTHIMQVSFE